MSRAGISGINPGHAHHLGGVPILVVEDDPDSRDLLAMILEMCGAQPHVAASVDEALTASERIAPAIVISDLAMPGKDGYTFVEAFRSRSPSGNVPVIAVTGHYLERHRALAAGFNDFILKPVDPERLCERLAHHLEQRGRGR